MLKFSPKKKIKENKSMKANIESSRIYFCQNENFKTNQLSIQQTCVKVAKVLQYVEINIPETQGKPIERS
jgi:hypothetical protein